MQPCTTCSAGACHGSKSLLCWTPSLQRASGRGHAFFLPVGSLITGGIADHHAAICNATCEMMRLLVWQVATTAQYPFALCDALEHMLDRHSSTALVCCWA